LKQPVLSDSFDLFHNFIGLAALLVKKYSFPVANPLFCGFKVGV
jgi:hypothetical protein